MGKRDDYVPEDFIKAFRRGVPGLKKLPQRHQVKPAFYAWIEGLYRYSHRVLDEYMRIGYMDLERSFGRGAFANINADLGMFEITPYWSKDSQWFHKIHLCTASSKFRS